MEYLWIINILLGVVLTMIGLLYKKDSRELSETKTRIDELEKNLPLKYVLKEDYWRDNQEIKQKLDKILDKLDTKADKNQGRINGNQ